VDGFRRRQGLLPWTDCVYTNHGNAACLPGINLTSVMPSLCLTLAESLASLVRSNVPWYIRTHGQPSEVQAPGHSYWRIVESRRVHGKPHLFVLAHLGKADDLWARLRAAEALRIESRSHGAVAALLAIARELDLIGTIDRHLAAVGCRDRRALHHQPDPQRRAERHEVLLSAKPWSLAVWAGLASHEQTGFFRMGTLHHARRARRRGRRQLSSQHFWDQMDQVPVEILGAIEHEIVGRALDRYRFNLDTVSIRRHEFFTFIDSTNSRPKLPARGHNKQKRHDLRQLGVALLCTRAEGIPLFHRTYGGEIHDSRSFADVLPSIRERSRWTRPRLAVADHRLRQGQCLSFQPRKRLTLHGSTTSLLLRFPISAPSSRKRTFISNPSRLATTNSCKPIVPVGKSGALTARWSSCCRSHFALARFAESTNIWPLLSVGLIDSATRLREASRDDLVRLYNATSRPDSWDASIYRNLPMGTLWRKAARAQV